MEAPVNNVDDACGMELVENEVQDVRLNVDGTVKLVEKELGKVSENKKKSHFPCLICSRKFKQNAGRYNHMRRVHNIYPGEKANVKCLEKGCSFKCSYKEKLQLHLSEDHGIKMDIIVKKFDSLQEFLRWKDGFERQEKSRFVKKSGSRIREEGIRVGYYYCSRSGTYVSQSKGMKNPKKKGTSKTNHHCTASITCFELPDGKLEVKICSTHYGHESELQHLRLTQTEKFQIVEQLCRGVPREMVLDNVRASTCSEIERIHLITMKDVKNIEKAYGIQANTNEKANNMFDNLTDWIRNIMSSENGPVLYFKEDRELNTKTPHITLILLTKGQLEVLRKYCISGVFYVSSFKSKNKPVSYCQNTCYEKDSAVHIISLMLLDDLNEAVPVSFMITNDLSHDKYKILFECLKHKVSEISARALFTDDQKDVFFIWCSVFQQEPLHLWSNRFVDSDWRENLVSILDEEVQVSIYERLYSFLESTDVKNVTTILVSYLNELQSNPTTNKFATYFLSKYVGAETMWAGCFGKSSVGVNAQLNMEITCNEIEEITNKKHWDRNFLVRIVQNLLKLVNEKQCVRQSKLQRQIHELQSHHTLALNVKPELILQESDDCWRVESAKDPSNIFSHVTCLSQKTCYELFCVLSCPKCNACAHQYECTCRVYMYDRTMCKHIHAVALSRIPKSEVTDVKEELPSNDMEKEPNEDQEPGSKWQANKIGRKKRTPDIAEDETVLKVIQDVLQNKNIKHPKQKRKKSKNGVEISNQKVDDNQSEELEEVPVRKLRERKTKVDLKQGNATKEENLCEDSRSPKPRRANILRRSKRV